MCVCRKTTIFIKLMIQARRVLFMSRIKFLSFLARATEIFRSTNTTFPAHHNNWIFPRRRLGRRLNFVGLPRIPQMDMQRIRSSEPWHAFRLEFFIFPMTNDFMQGKVAHVSRVINVKCSRADHIRLMLNKSSFTIVTSIRY